MALAPKKSAMVDRLVAKSMGSPVEGVEIVVVLGVVPCTVETFSLISVVGFGVIDLLAIAELPSAFATNARFLAKLFLERVSC